LFIWTIVLSIAGFGAVSSNKMCSVDSTIKCFWNEIHEYKDSLDKIRIKEGENQKVILINDNISYLK
jgi:hypothetical protein